MNWNDKKMERMYNRIKKEAVDRGFDESRFDSPYINKLCKETKSPRITRMIEEAYYLGMLRGIHYVDEMKTPIVLRDLEFTPDDDETNSTLEYIDRKGNVLLISFKDKEREIKKEIALDYNVFVVDYEDLDYDINDAENGKCPLFVISTKKKDPYTWETPESIVSGKEAVRFYVGDKYEKVMNILKPLEFVPTLFPENKKIVDFEKKGNQVKFYLGNLDCEDYWGDDWNDYPYEHNAGTVYDRFYDTEWVISFPYRYAVVEPRDGVDNSNYSKEDMKQMNVPCIVYLDDEDEWYPTFSGVSLQKDSHKIYFNDTKETIDI